MGNWAILPQFQTQSSPIRYLEIGIYRNDILETLNDNRVP